MSNGSGTGPDPDQTTQEAMAWAQLGLQLAQQLGLPGSDAVAHAMGISLNHVKIPASAAKFIGAIISALAEIVAGCLDGLEAAKENSGDGINRLIAAVIQDLMNVNVAPQLSGSGGGSGNATVDPTATGNALFGVLTDLFGGLQPITPDQGQQNAKALLGFGVNFAIVTGFLGLIGGFVPFAHVDELKGFGEDLAHVLGLGRLTHTAVTPLIRNMISQPLDLWLRDILRPDRLSEAQLVRALHAGQLDQDTFNQAMAEKGYRDQDIALLIQDLAAKVQGSELETLVRYGVITTDQAVSQLQNQGMPQASAQQEMQALDEAKGDSQVGAFLSDLENARVAGFMSQVEFSANVDDLPLSDEEDRLYRKRVAAKVERTRKTLSEGQVMKCVVDGILDFNYFDTWLTNEGYSSDDQTALYFLLAEQMKAAADKEKAKQWRAQQLRLKGKPVPPWLQG